jgi:hypothetical protein
MIVSWIIFSVFLSPCIIDCICVDMCCSLEWWTWQWSIWWATCWITMGGSVAILTFSVGVNLVANYTISAGMRLHKETDSLVGVVENGAVYTIQNPDKLFSGSISPKRGADPSMQVSQSKRRKSNSQDNAPSSAPAPQPPQ